MKKLLRLIVMMSIRTPEESYKTAAKSVGLDITEMSSSEVSAWKATLKALEADYLIDIAFKSPHEDSEKMLDIAYELAKKINDNE